MSNIIRANHIPTLEKKVIQTKKIDFNIDTVIEEEVDPIVKKQQLLQEIKSLESRYQELLEEMNEEKAKAEEEIENWWEEKQQEAIEYAENQGEEAKRAGFEKGFQQGMLQAEQEFQGKIQQAEDLIQTAYVENKKIIQSSESFLLNLSVKIAEKVIKTQIQLDHQKLVDMVRLTLKQIEESEDITVQVSPEDYPIILPFVDELQTYVSGDSTFKVIPSSKLSPGGCMIHTPSGSYDVAVDSQLSEIKKQLLIFYEGKTNHDQQDR